MIIAESNNSKIPPRKDIQTPLSNIVFYVMKMLGVISCYNYNKDCNYNKDLSHYNKDFHWLICTMQVQRWFGALYIPVDYLVDSRPLWYMYDIVHGPSQDNSGCSAIIVSL